MVQSRESMEQASVSLPPVISYHDGLPIYFLTGKNYLYQTLFCIQSLAKVSSEKFNFILVDDGSFDDKLIDRIKKQLPEATIIKKENITSRLNDILPESSYPILNQKRKVYAHIKKLTDIHCLPGNDWKLVLDSDMLFWDEPKEIVEWLKAPGTPLHMIDCDNAYGYSIPFMEDICTTAIKMRINVGTIGLNSTQIYWDKVEYWIGALENNHGTSYYLEQALTAMLIGDKQTVALDANEYIVNPDKHSRGKLHHYVDLSKALYFNEMWQKLV